MPPSRRFKTQLINLLRQLGSLALIGLIASYLDFRHLLEVSTRIKPAYLLLVICVLMMERAVIAARWPILLRTKGHQVSFWDAFKVDLISSFFGMALPSLAAGDAVRGYRLFRLTADLKRSFSSILLDRLIGVVTLGFTAVISLFLGWRTFGGSIAIVGLGCFILFVTILIFLTTSPRVLQAPEQLFPSLQKSKIWKALALFHEDLRQYKLSKLAIFAVFLLSMATQLFRVLAAYTASLSLGATPPFFLFILFIPIVFTVKMLPISIGGVGAREATFAVLFGWAGMAREEGVLVGLTISALSLLYAMVGGILYLYERPKSKQTVGTKISLKLDTNNL